MRPPRVSYSKEILPVQFTAFFIFFKHTAQQVYYLEYYICIKLLEKKDSDEPSQSVYASLRNMSMQNFVQ